METQKIDDGIIEHLAIVIETLLLDPSDKGFASALLSFVPLQETDFPNKKLGKLFREIKKKYSDAKKKAENRIQSKNPPSPYLYCSFIKGQSRKWLKKRFWQLFKESVRNNCCPLA